MNGYLAVIGSLATDASLGVLIGGSGFGNARVFPGDSPQAVPFPHVSVDTFDADPHDTQSGVATLDSDIVKVFARSPKDSICAQMSEAIRDRLDGASGVFGSITMEYCRYLRTDQYDDRVTGQGTTEHQRIRVHEHDYEVRVRVNS